MKETCDSSERVKSHEVQPIFPSFLEHSELLSIEPNYSKVYSHSVSQTRNLVYVQAFTAKHSLDSFQPDTGLFKRDWNNVTFDILL